MTPGFDPTQVDWNNPDVEYLMKDFERTMVDYRDEIMSLTKSNNQLASEKEQIASRNKELEERCSHLEAKYDRPIEMYNRLLGGACNGIAPDNPPVDPDAVSKTIPKRHPGYMQWMEQLDPADTGSAFQSMFFRWRHARIP